MERLAHRLHLVELQLAEAEGRIARQRELIGRMTAAGWDTRLAESLLRTMEETVRILRSEADEQRRLGEAWRDCDRGLPN